MSLFEPVVDHSLGRPGGRAFAVARRPRGLPLHDGRRFLGHVSVRGLGHDPAGFPDLPHSLHVARCLASNPDALALLHRSRTAEALALLGRRLMGWMA